MPEELLVRAGARDYRVILTTDSADHAKTAATNRSVLVCDAAVAALHPELCALWPPERVIAIEATEANKRLEGCTSLMVELVRREVRRDFTLVALGGGIIQDVTAFTASVLYRGIQWAFFPTTLLAQADSCIGSKSSINLGETKNVVGTFYPPSWVVIDPVFLESLAVEDIESGIGEMLHYFVYADSPALERLIREHDRVLTERSRLQPYIRESLAIKKVVIEDDELDQGERNKFNYGHTFGHAIEAASDFSVRHGHAVTVGMDIANYVSVGLGLMSQETYDRLHELLRVNFPSHDWTGFDVDRYLRALARDKKNLGDSVVCILAESPGKLMKTALPLEGELTSRIRGYFAEGLCHK